MSCYICTVLEKRKMKLSTREESIMNILWQKKRAFVKEIIEALEEEPKPAYNTISSITRRMVDKGWVGFEAFGKTHQYYPILKKETLKKKRAKQLIQDYFENSFKDMVSYFVQNDIVDQEEVEKILEEIKQSENE